MGFLAPIFFVIIFLMIFSRENPKEKKAEKFKDLISQKGELLRFYRNTDFFNSTHHNDYIFFYLPKSEPIIVEKRKISTEDGEMCIHLASTDIEVGNKVFLNNSPAPDGKYKIGFLHYIYVKDERIC